MRIYCDSNIFRLVDEEHLKFDIELLDGMNQLKNILLFVFSDAHITDLKKSVMPYLESNLEIMTRYVQDNYFVRDHIYKTDKIFLAYPKEVYDDRDFSIMDNFLKNPKVEIDKIIDGFESELDHIKWDTFLKNTYDNLESKYNISENPELEKYFKIVKSTNISELVGNVFSGSFAHVEDNKWIQTIKKSLADYINTNEYSFSKWESDFERKVGNKKTIENILKKLNSLTSIQEQDEYSKFINFYIRLELFGITKEKVGNKNKKFNFMSLITDANHAFYASKCDYFVSGDVGVLIKSFITYKAFKIDTQVLSILDLKIKIPSFIRNETGIDSFFKTVDFYAGTGFIIREDLAGRLIKIDFPFFNYFNRLQIISKGNSIILFKNSHYWGYMYKELQMISEKVISMIGLDDYNIGAFNKLEYDDFGNDIIIRIWTVKQFQFQLFVSRHPMEEIKYVFKYSIFKKYN